MPEVSAGCARSGVRGPGAQSRPAGRPRGARWGNGALTGHLPGRSAGLVRLPWRPVTVGPRARPRGWGGGTRIGASFGHRSLRPGSLAPHCRAPQGLSLPGGPFEGVWQRGRRGGAGHGCQRPASGVGVTFPRPQPVLVFLLPQRRVPHSGARCKHCLPAISVPPPAPRQHCI